MEVHFHFVHLRCASARTARRRRLSAVWWRQRSMRSSFDLCQNCKWIFMRYCNCAAFGVVMTTIRHILEDKAVRYGLSVPATKSTTQLR